MTGPVLLALLGTVATTPVLIEGLRRAGRFDVPGARSLHVEPTPRGGGLAPVAFLVLGVAAWQGAPGRELVTIGAVIAGLAALGAGDDVFGLGARPRLLGQVVVGVVATVGLDVAGGHGVLLAAVAVAWIVAFVNSFNFMDGANGLASGQALVAGLAWWLLGRHLGVSEIEVLGALLAAVAAGFLPFNFPTAKVFLGDVGSYGLGGAAAVIVVVGVRDGVSSLAMLAPLSLFLVDTSTTLLRRAAQRVPLLEAHRDHAFQRLAAAGWGHPRITTTMVALMSLSALMGGTRTFQGAVGVALVAAGYLALPAWLTRTRPVSPPG